MELVYAALLIHKSGKEITPDSLKKVMEAAGAQVDDSKIRALVAALDGVDIDQAIKEAVAVGAAPAEVSVEQASEEKKEEKTEEEKKEEEAKSAAGLGALFG
tara:strand:- start:93 stop:398 length:306 start_codon:yes stop_codon:yes gene_type:complete